MRRSWDRQQWRQKKELNRGIKIRAQEPSNASYDFVNVSRDFDSSGAIYGLYHFTTGRWYIGQTVNPIHKRVQQHWWSRFRDQDLFHEALALEETPFCFIAIPLEWIPDDLYKAKEQTRKQTVNRFRAAATPRERYWVGKLNSLWPIGWNSTIPGKPASHSCQRRLWNPAGVVYQTEEFFDAALWLTRWTRDPEQGIAERVRQPKPVIRDVLHYLQTSYKPENIVVRGLSPTTQLIDLFRNRRDGQPKGSI